MKRFKVLFGQRRFQVLATLAVVLVAAAVVVGSGASFTAQTANPTNVFTSGDLSMTNSNPDAAIVTFDLMVPGDTKAGTVTIQNTGKVQGNFFLQPVTLADGPTLAADLDLVIMDGTTEVYNGKLSALTQQDLGTYAAGAFHTYSFKVTFPNTDVVPSSMATTVGADNGLEGITTAATFTWTTVSVPTT